MNLFNKLSTAFLIFIIFAASNVTTYRFTQYFDERSAIKMGYGGYNNLNDFEWKSSDEISNNRAAELKDQAARLKSEFDKQVNAQKLNQNKFW